MIIIYLRNYFLKQSLHTFIPESGECSLPEEPLQSDSPARMYYISKSNILSSIICANHQTPQPSNKTSQHNSNSPLFTKVHKPFEKFFTWKAHQYPFFRSVSKNRSYPFFGRKKSLLTQQKSQYHEVTARKHYLKMRKISTCSDRWSGKWFCDEIRCRVLVSSNWQEFGERQIQPLRCSMEAWFTLTLRRNMDKVVDDSNNNNKIQWHVQFR